MKRKFRIWFYQKIAKAILSIGYKCPIHQVQFWFDMGMKLDTYCIENYDIYLE